MIAIDRCHCGAAKYVLHPILGALCWWHSALERRFRGNEEA